MVLHRPGTLIWPAGLLYLGLFMVIDPAGFLTLIDALACGLRNFERHLYGLGWQEPWSEPERGSHSPRARAAARCAGAALSILALAPLVAALQ